MFHLTMCTTHVTICRYKWQKNGKPFEWQVYDKRISQQPGRGTLVVTSPKTEDIGKSTHVSFPWSPLFSWHTCCMIIIIRQSYSNALFLFSLSLCTFLSFLRWWTFRLPQYRRYCVICMNTNPIHTYIKKKVFFLSVNLILFFPTPNRVTRCKHVLWPNSFSKCLITK